MDEYRYVKCPRCKSNLIIEHEKICIRCERELRQIEEKYGGFSENILIHEIKDLPKHIYLDNPEDVVVHESIRTTCLQKHHRVELRNATFPYQSPKSNIMFPINIVADYCYDCKQYQVSKLRLREYEKTQGKVMYRRPQKVVESTVERWGEITLDRWGYTANKNTTDEGRQKYLSYLIDNIPEITVESATADLEKVASMNINMHFDTRYGAIQRRLADRDFLHNKYLKNNPVHVKSGN